MATIELLPFGYPMTLRYEIKPENNPILWGEAPHIGCAVCLLAALVGEHDIIKQLSYTQICFIEKQIAEAIEVTA